MEEPLGAVELDLGAALITGGDPIVIVDQRTLKLGASGGTLITGGDPIVIVDEDGGDPAPRSAPSTWRRLFHEVDHVHSARPERRPARPTAATRPVPRPP